ncbi:VOC family protein [Pseudoruegeria sp. SHC-113]|uniref:VOC family protein n=1 Tax=Pseudoruegeria sp. SHC-113 TaxID=2855439 RepID=UPI0021BB510A|nr:VOC family protein [Pseudoruegeria sp. SHC-113]MCT8161501.1 VOC family protein [Pseudoruegeria sp. SHC-113]
MGLGLELDHIAVAAETLEEGVAWVEERLGVQMLPGGQHPLMGTHNRLLGLADGLYFEVIAVDPAAPKPPHARWFDLDRFSGPPRIANWILRTPDLAAAFAAFGPAAGTPVALARGDLRWQMAVPETGILPLDGIFPALIEWESAAHPAQRLAPSGLRLSRLDVRHPEIDTLYLPGFSDPRVAFLSGPAGFSARFEGPDGERTLT